MTAVAEPALMLTVDEAAKLMRISRSAAYRSIGRGEIPAVRFGRAIRVPYHALLETLERRATQTTP